MADVGLVLVSDVAHLTTENTLLASIPVDIDRRSSRRRFLYVGSDGPKLFDARLETPLLGVRDITSVDESRIPLLESGRRASRAIPCLRACPRRQESADATYRGTRTASFRRRQRYRALETRSRGGSCGVHRRVRRYRDVGAMDPMSPFERHHTHSGERSSASALRRCSRNVVFVTPSSSAISRVVVSRGHE